MTGETNEEAAWRDLVAHYATPAVADGVPAPWPTREDLPGPGPQGQDPAGQDSSGTDTADLDITGLDLAEPEGTEHNQAQRDRAQRDQEQRDPEQRPGPARPAGPAPFGLTPGPPQIRIVRPASQPAGGDDDHFVPPVPPPLPRLDPVTKGAWAALFGGPLYLLIAVMASWQVPDWAAFCAVAAFIGGFATLVVRMGDRPPRDSGPDDGAVV
jgi:hypothetical protein